MHLVTTGNSTVDAIGKINLIGLAIPRIWYQRINRVTPKGEQQPDAIAVALLADLVDWHRPCWDGTVKFKGEYFQRQLSAYADFFGVSLNRIKAASDVLESLGLASRFVEERRMMWKVHPAAIKKITYP